MISVLTFKWSKPGYRSVFSGQHVNILRDMVRRNTKIPHRFICITDDPTGIDNDIEIVPLWPNPAPKYGNKDRPNCFYRLRAFDPEMKNVLGEKFIWLDLDTVILGNLDHILSDPAEFKIWKVDGERMPCNGSMVMCKAGARAQIWSEFNPALVCDRTGLRRLDGFVGSDQAWMARYLKLDDEFFGMKDGVLSFRCHIREPRARLPHKARIVFFHGRYDPWHTDLQRRYPWIKENYMVKHDQSRGIETPNNDRAAS